MSHIADVTHFVDENTILDEEARLRTTSVYLTHRVIPMLPRLLCENFCSLNPGLERLAFSVICEIDDQGIVDEKTITFQKTVIKSCCKMSYDQVQKMITGEYKSYKDLPESQQPQLPSEQKKDEFFNSVLELSKLGLLRRENRLKDGFVQINKVKKLFQLNKNTFWPESYKLEQRYEANFVVEEFMLLANQLVGKKLVDVYQPGAILRRHNAPQELKRTYLETLLKTLRLPNFDFSTLKSFQHSMEELQKNIHIKDEYKKLLGFRIIKVLEAAQYFVVQDTQPETWRHYALNFEVYTHFTSPIRRYPDVLVHRLLQKALVYKDEMAKHVDIKSMTEIMEKCNQCKKASRIVSDDCEKIFLCLYLKENSVIVDAIVQSVTNLVINM